MERIEVVTGNTLTETAYALRWNHHRRLSSNDNRGDVKFLTQFTSSRFSARRALVSTSLRTEIITDPPATLGCSRKSRNHLPRHKLSTVPHSCVVHLTRAPPTRTSTQTAGKFPSLRWGMWQHTIQPYSVLEMSPLMTSCDIRPASLWLVQLVENFRFSSTTRNVTSARP